MVGAAGARADPGKGAARSHAGIPFPLSLVIFPMILDSTDYEADCRARLDELRAALIDLYAGVGADPSSPQDVARRFGVNKTLTWNIARVVGGTDAMRTLQHVPGASAIQSLLGAFERDGAEPANVERVRNASRALDRTVERHFGDRATLDLILDGISPDRGDHLELSRKLAYRGNSGLWGVQSKARLMTAMLAPNAQDPSMIDAVLIRGYVALRRLRSDIRWPIFQVRGWGSEGKMTDVNRWQPLEPIDGPDNGLPLLKRFSTVTPADVDAKRGARGMNYLLAPGPVGNFGAVDCYMSDYARAIASKYRTERDATGEFGATISVPTERLVFDLIVHESLDFALTPEVRAVAGIFMERTDDPDPDTQADIPVPQEVQKLPGRPPVVTTPSVPGYAGIVQYANERMGWNGSDFRGCRFEMAYPPLGSTILLRFKLPPPPAK